MDLKSLEELFELEQQLDIAMKDRFHKTLTDEQISILTAPKGSYPAEDTPGCGDQNQSFEEYLKTKLK